MTDRELLELAAKAAGICLEWDGPPDIWQPLYYKGKTYHYWNPLTDDGDALRLAVKLRDRVPAVHLLPANADAAATRRAIVRAAAEIGKAMS